MRIEITVSELTASVYAPAKLEQGYLVSVRGPFTLEVTNFAHQYEQLALDAAVCWAVNRLIEMAKEAENGV